MTIDELIATAPAHLREGAREEYEERAAIVEFCGNVHRFVAEQSALVGTKQWLERRA